MTEKLVIAGTGHRPGKYFSYSEEDLQLLTKICKIYLTELAPTEVISGMALGYDMALALAAIELEIPLCAAIPFKGQENRWPKQTQERYNFILSKTSRVVIVCEGEYHPYKMQIRNEWMVDNSDLILTLYDGLENGGTWNCIKYCNSKNKDIVNIWGSFKDIVNKTNDNEQI